MLVSTKTVPRTSNFSDKHGKTRAWLKTSPTGLPSLTLWDENDHLRAMLGTDADGSPSLLLNDEKEHSRAVLGNVGLENTKTGSTENTGPSSLVLFGKDRRVIWRAP